jgi:hypothetical protein
LKICGRFSPRERACIAFSNEHYAAAGSATSFFVERCAVKDPTEFLKIKVLGMEASAGGRFAIVALVLIFFAVLAVHLLG